MGGAANNLAEAQAPPARLGRVFPRGWFWMLVSVLIWVSAGVVYFEVPRTCLYGWLRLEPTYRGLPASFWCAVIQECVGGPPIPGLPPSDVFELLQYRVKMLIDQYLSLRSFERWLDPNDSRLRSVAMHLSTDDNRMVRLTGNCCLASQVQHYPELLPLVERSLESKSALERQMVIQIMRQLGPGARIALPKLKELFSREQRHLEKIQLAASVLQVAPGDQAAQEYLFSLTKPGPDGVRDEKLALMALLDLSCLRLPIKERIPEILELSRDPNSKVAVGAQQVLVRWDLGLARQKLEERPTRKPDE